MIVVLYGVQVVATQQGACLFREAKDVLSCSQLLLWTLVDTDGHGAIRVLHVHKEHVAATVPQVERLQLFYRDVTIKLFYRGMTVTSLGDNKTTVLLRSNNNLIRRYSKDYNDTTTHHSVRGQEKWYVTVSN